MKIFKIFLLLLFLWPTPTFILYSFGETLGSLFSYFSFILLIVYFFLNKKGQIPYPFLILGVLYFMISGLVNVEDPIFFLRDFIKYIIVIICSIQLLKNSSDEDLYFIFIAGALTIFIEAIFFQSGSGGRYAGVFLNPNSAGFICIVGYCLGYGINNKYIRIFGQFLFIFAGILTFSRTFILLLIIISVVAAFTNRKHLITIGIGVFAFIFLFSLSTSLKLDTARFNALEGLFENKVDTHTITDDSRSETWSLYTHTIINNIIFGNGYKSMQGWEADTVGIKVGVHNTYLMILGESGIIPFLVFIFIFVNLFIKSVLIYFKENPEYSFLTFVLIMFLLTSHNYFDNYALITISLWLYIRIRYKYDYKNVFD